MSGPDELLVWVPSNNRDKRGNPQPFDGLNEIIRQARGNSLAANARKHKNEKHVAGYVAAEMERTGWTAPAGPCEVTLTFVEVGARRDPDNVFGAAKFILDALCTPVHTGRVGRRGKEVVIHADGCSALVDDSQEYVRLTCRLAEEPSRESPGVWVSIREVAE